MPKGVKRNPDRHTKKSLLEDALWLVHAAQRQQYSLAAKDIFAWGYLAGKYGLERLKQNQENVIEACRQYDEKDDLALYDTIGETLIDLEAIRNDGCL